MDGSITVLALVQEDSSSFIRKGVVYNLEKTAQCLTSIVKKLTSALKTNITRVFVGVGGQSLRSIRNVIQRDLPENTIVTQEMIIDLMDLNRNKKYQDQEILDVATQEYKVDSQLQIDPVGIQCNHLEGNFLNIIARNTVYKNLNKCFETAGIAVAEMYMAPIALANSVLTEAEKRSGCALVDLGADTTTVSVFSKNILRHLAVIPLGGNNITKDIASIQMEESDAEKMKLKYGCAYTDNTEIDNTLMLSVDAERSVESRKFIEIVEGRLEEIVENVWYQIQSSDYDDKLLGGIILTGGGSNMKNIEKAFINHTHVDKIRIAKFVTQTINSNYPELNAKNGRMNTVLGLLARGDMNCAGREIDINGNSLFDDHEQEETEMEMAKATKEPTTGVVRTEMEKKKAEDAARIAEEEAVKKRIAEEEAEKEAQERASHKRNKKSLFNKALEGIKNFSKKIVEEE